MTDTKVYQGILYSVDEGGIPRINRVVEYVAGSTTGGSVSAFSEVAYVLGVAPADDVYVQQETSYTVGNAAVGSAKVSQIAAYLLHGELPATRRLRAWTFSLDGHDFYVLMLGISGTLIYDVSTGQCFTWQSLGYEVWRAAFGLNWENDIIAGDLINGSVYNVDPESKLDYGTETIVSYVTGFIGHRGRDPLPCWGVTLITSQGDPSDANSGVELRISDDLEQSWFNAGKLTLPEIGKTDYDLSWYSLGQISQPGRIFQLIDYGYADRIDALEFLEERK